MNTRLGKLPKDLKATYDDIYLRQIKNRGEIESAIAERAIMWLLVAFEPLTSKHLLAAVRINAGPYNEMLLEPEKDVPGQHGTPEAPHVQFVKGDIDEELLLELCANLLTLDAATGKWNFAHASVLEYFEAHHFSVVHAHAYVGFVSLMVIIDVAQSKTAYVPPGQSPITKDGENEQEHEDQGPEYRKPSSNRAIYRSLFQHSLVVYTFGHWGNHVSLVDKGVNTLKAVQDCTFESDAHTITDGLRILLQRFLGHPNNGSSEYRFWRNAFDYWVYPLRWDVLGPDLGLALLDIYSGEATDTYASFAAVHYGFFNMLPKWWQDSCGGHDRGTCPTCEAWPSIDTTATTEVERWSLLAIASYFGQTHIIHALLSIGMKFNSGENTWFRSDPLRLAGGQGHLEACRVLINYCQPERPLGIDDALYFAAQGHHHNVFRYLLSAGADPNHHCRGPDWQDAGTVLELAARTNNFEVLGIIFEDNGDQPREHVPSQSELVSAAFSAAYDLSLDALQCLVSDGHIDPNARYSDQRFETILLAAAHNISSWSSSTFRCLRECGVDFNIHEEDLRRLRKSQQSFHYTLLEAVVLTGDMDLLQVAVEEWGEDVNAIFNDSKDSRYGCALIAAVEKGHLEVVQYLLKKNADANCQVPKRSLGTPLSTALQKSHFAIANALIEHGADINMPIKHGEAGSALVVAAYEHTVDALKFAINAGALIDAPLEYGLFGSALIRATRYSRMANAQYLLDHGADINYQATIGEFPSALMAASFPRNRDMVSFLIKRGADVDRPENHGWDTMLERRRSVQYSSSWSSDTD